jgi:cysteine desulfurase
VLIRALSEHGVCISSGSACSSKKLSRPVLEAMKLPKEQIQNAVRFSFCPSHTREDIENLLVLLKNTVNQYG